MGKCSKVEVESVRCPCGMNSNSIWCIVCGKRIYKGWNGVSVNLGKVHKFQCTICETGGSKQDDNYRV